MFYVEHRYIYGWDDACWTENGKPLRFKTQSEAQTEIDRVCRNIGYRPSDYRVVPVSNLDEKNES